MQFEEHYQQGVWIVRPLERRLDAEVIQEFKLFMSGKIRAGHLLIALDLGDVDFIDSSGLGGIISVLKAVGDSGNVAVFGADKNVLSLFRLTRLDRVIPMMDSLEEVLIALSK
jgi:anti-sigma B factor antagonist